MNNFPDPVELLEPRVAPASVSITYIDVDGDRVTITARNSLAVAPPLDAADLNFAGGGEGGQLAVLNLGGAGFDGADITFSVKKGPGGNGLADVGKIDAAGINLGKIVVKGDLGRIVAGDGSGQAIMSLQVRSMGLDGLASQGGAGSIQSDIKGSLGVLKIARDIKDASINAGTIGKVTIGGSLVGGDAPFSGKISTSGGLGPVTIGGDIVGGAGSNSGQISSEGKLIRLDLQGSVIGGSGLSSGSILSRVGAGSIAIGRNVLGGIGGNSGWIDIVGSLDSLTIKGSLIGSKGSYFLFDGVTNLQHEGQVFVSGNIGPVKIGRDVIGSTGGASGEIRSEGIIASVKIGGSLIGGSGVAGGHIASKGSTGNVTIGGNIVGGTTAFTGFVESFGSIGNVTVRGSIIGGTATSTGLVSSAEDMGKVNVAGDLQGGSITGTEPGFSSSGVIGSGGRIAKVTIGGSIIAGVDNSTGGVLLQNGSVGASDDIGSLTVKGSLVGSITPNGRTPVIISVRGEAVPTGSTDLAIGKINIVGRVERALILGGYLPFVDPASTPAASSNGNAQIGPVLVGGDWIASSLAAGVRDAANDGFGNADDGVIPGSNADEILSRIASIRISGTVFGSSAIGDQFGFTAQQIGSFKAGGLNALLTRGTDPALLLAPVTGDVFLREV